MAGLLILLTRAAPGVLQAAEKVFASSSYETLQQAAQAIPLDKLSAQQSAAVRDVLANVSVFRRLPTQVFECDPSMYLFLVENPEVVVNIWGVMGISEIELKRVAPNRFQADDGAGTLGEVSLLHRSHDTHLWYATGSYAGPMFSTPARGRCVLMLKTGYVREPNGSYYITCRMDAFLQLEHAGVELLAKAIQPLVVHVADQNFQETAAFVASVSEAAKVNQPGIRRLAEKLTTVQPQTRDKFVQVAEKVAAEASADRAEMAARESRLDTSPPQPSLRRPTWRR